MGYRVRQGGYVGKTVSLTLRDSDLLFHSWSASLAEYTDLSEDLYGMAGRLLEANWPEWKKVRLVGVSLSKLMKKGFEQLDLLGEKEKLRKLAQACDEIRERFGYSKIQRGSSITEAGIYRG